MRAFLFWRQQTKNNPGLNQELCIVSNKDNKYTRICMFRHADFVQEKHCLLVF